MKRKIVDQENFKNLVNQTDVHLYFKYETFIKGSTKTFYFKRIDGDCIVFILEMKKDQWTYRFNSHVYSWELEPISKLMLSASGFHLFTISKSKRVSGPSRQKVEENH